MRGEEICEQEEELHDCFRRNSHSNIRVSQLVIENAADKVHFNS